MEELVSKILFTFFIVSIPVAGVFWYAYALYKGYQKTKTYLQKDNNTPQLYTPDEYQG